MSEDKSRSERPLTNAQKDTARRLGMSEKEYSQAVTAQIKSGKLKPEHIS